jgi:hypothetical protein
MSSRKLAMAVAAAAMVVCSVMPAVAGARRNPRPRLHPARPHLGKRHKRSTSVSGCHLTLGAAPRTVTSGEAPELFGRLKCPSGAEVGQAVTVYGHSSGQPTKVLGTSTTQAGGFYTFVAPGPTTDTLYYASSAGATSATRAVRVAPAVTMHGPSEGKALLTGANHGGGVLFTGTVSPADTGAEVVLQREQAIAVEEWHTIQRGRLRAGGVYSFLHVFSIPGDANIRVVVRPHRKFSAFGASSPLSYVISQRQNPHLTLTATSTGAFTDPIFYSQPLTLQGVVAAGAGDSVTLEARSGKTGQFAPLATTTASSSGHYSFAQAPLQNTAYRTVAGGHHSAILFEGVKYILSPVAVPTSAQAGQTLVFTGTVTPFQAGHMVYLERQNANGGGFHIADKAALVAGTAGSGTFSISHRVFGAGKEVFRLKVPGDPANQGVASVPFTIEVTPGSAATLPTGP